MSSYGDYGYGYENNYGYGNDGYNQGGGRNASGRKRRGNYDQMQQYEQRRSRQWRGGNRGGWGDHEDDWYGESYDDNYYGGSHWDNEDYGYNDGYGNSRKRGRFYDNDSRGGQYMERGPHSVNFYDDYDDSYSRGPPRHGRSRYDSDRRGSSQSRRYESDYSWQRDGGHPGRRNDGAPPYRNRKEPTKRLIKPSRKKTDAEDAIYEKHKKVTVERGKREKIASTVHAVVAAFREVSFTIAKEEHEKKVEAEKKQAEEEMQTSAVETENKVEAEKKQAEEEMQTSAVETEKISETDTDIKEIEQEKEEEIAGENAEADNASSDKTDADCEAHTENKVVEASTDLQVAKEVKKENKESNDDKSNNEKVVKEKYEPVLLSAIKCGESAMRILVGDNLEATVVVVTKRKPTRKLLHRVSDRLLEVLAVDKRMKNETFHINFDEVQESLILKQEGIDGFHIIIRFTSPECSADAPESDKEDVPEDSADVLSDKSCTAASVQLRRMRFFVKKLDSSPVSLTVLRILLHFRNSIVGWEKLPVWLALILVDIARFTLLGENPDVDTERDLYRVDSLLMRCLEILSSGVLMPHSRGIKDPCEVDKDAGEELDLQDAESITSAAQHIMRRVYFGQIRAVLDVDDN